MSAQATRYPGRPGLPATVAALVATGWLRKDHRILDVGCGTGTDALTLAAWGFRHVVGIDPDKGAIAIARRRATRLGLARHVRFDAVSAEELEGSPLAGRFNVVLHTLVANNLRRGKAAHFRGVAAALRPEGQLVMHERIGAGWAGRAPGTIAPLDAARRHFVMAPGVVTRIAEWGPEPRSREHALVVLWLGRPRKR